MKKLLTAFLCLLSGIAFSQKPLEKEIKTEAAEVTVFMEGAQITRTKSVELTPGKSILKFANLSPFIDPKSIQVKAAGELTVLSVLHLQNYLDKAEDSDELKRLKTRLKELDATIQTESAYKDILIQEMAFLEKNSEIGGKNQAVSVASLQEAADFYRNRLTALKLKEIERAQSLITLQKEKTDLENQLNSLSLKKEFPSGEILVTVDAKKNQSALFELTYVAGNCGWSPSYDIRANTVSEPVELIYKANVRQDTKEEWNNVKLRLSSSNPNVSGVAPKLETYYLRYPEPAPIYKMQRENLVLEMADTEKEDTPPIRIRGTASSPVPVVRQENQTAISFDIKTPYTIKPDNKSYAVEVVAIELPAIFQYYCVPKMDKDAFLIARIPGFEQYNLLEGEASVFFEGTFVGKTVLDPRVASDTLEISLGRDKNVSVKREKAGEFSSKQFMGSKKEVIRGWTTTVKNNKSQKINMVILDQVPVSTAEEIEVSVRQHTGAVHHPETGEMKWEFTLAPAEKKEFVLEYAVKYPKSKTLLVD